MDTFKLLKYFRCELSPEEEAEVAHYLADDPDGSHRAAYKEARVLFETLAVHSDAFQVKVKERKPSFSRFVRSIAVAASIALFTAVGIQWSKEDLYTKLSSCHMTLRIPAEQNLQLTLEDGTLLWLGSGSEVEIPQVFSTYRRNIKVVKGEVYLEVAEDAERPFMVNTYAGDVKVMGTRFNVIVDKDNDYFSTTLFEGSVEVSGTASPSIKYLLKPSDELVMDKGVWRIDKISSTSDTPLWINGIIDIAGVSFDKLMLKFERIYDVDIIVEREDIPQVNYTMGKIRIKDGVQHAMEMLRLSSDFDYEYDTENKLIYIR